MSDPAPEPVAAAIRDYAAEHGLRSGDRLPPERELARILGVSRPALREATRRLVDVGLLRQRQGSGTFLADVDPGELQAVRERLEPLAAELAAAHAGDAARAELDALAARMAATLDDPDAFAVADLRLHAAIARASGNHVLVRVLDDLDALLRVSRARTAASRDTRERALDEVGRLLAAIAAGDAAAAGDAMREHLRSVARGGERRP